MYRAKSEEALTKKLNKIKEKFKKQMVIAVSDGVNKTETEAKKNSPRDTGKLQDKGWKKGMGMKGDIITGFVINDVQNEKGTFYASFTEEGTSKIGAKKYLEKALDKGSNEMNKSVEKRLEKLFE